MTPAELAAALGISTRQVQRLESAGLPFTPVGVRKKDYDLAACRAWLQANRDTIAQCLSTRPRTVDSTSMSASAASAFIAASRRVQLRTMPSSAKPSCEPRSGEASPLSLVTPS
jgi:hypothetical protein